MAASYLNGDQNKGVTVEKFTVLFDNLSYCTLLNLGYFGEPVGAPKDAESAIKGILRDRTPRTIFATPLSKVVASSLTAEFLEESRREQSAWRRRLEDVIASPKRMQRYFDIDNPQIKNPLVRQLELTGILIIEGRHIFPDRWPKPDTPRGPRSEQTPQRSNQESEPRIIVGDAYRRLKVLELLPQGRVLCECQCEKRTKHIVWRRHLLSGRTTSCGCARRRQKALHQERNGRRAR